MKNKLGIQTRVFLNFSIFIILIVNIFVFILFFLVFENIKTNIFNGMKSEVETIKTFIDLQSSNIFSLSKYEIEKINNLGYYFYIGNNDYELQEKYSLGFSNIKDNLLYRGDYKGFNIIIGKDIKEYKNIREIFIDLIILLNIFLIITIFLLSYFITKISLKPLLNLSLFLNNYKNNTRILKNNYGISEIGILTDSINTFINKNNNILSSQTSFIQDVNHELKTPLMQIESNIELMEGKIGDDKIKQRINSIKQSTENINEIVSNLGFILRGEKINISKEKININNYFQNFLIKFDSLLKNKNIQIEIEKKYELLIDNNSYYLDRLFGNILSNSIFYNKGNNDILIIINKNSITIKDKGVGIKKEDLDKIFTRFFRSQNSGLYYKDGNGLGLVIVKKICDMFGWKIEIKSEEGKGTNIKINL